MRICLAASQCHGHPVHAWTRPWYCRGDTRVRPAARGQADPGHHAKHHGVWHAL